MPGQSISRDVQDQLLSSWTRKRPSGEVPYPVQYSHEQLACDNWNHMFLIDFCRDLTMHPFQSAPSYVLDLGCGSGLWVLEAARAWPITRFVGFDILRVQPDLKRSALEETPNSHVLQEMSERIRWKHGNLLDPLPFASATFDFVRMCGLGLAVPEDEWQDLLQEVSRIMKPGAILEIIEEDLIFPAARRAASETSPGRLHPYLTRLPPSPTSPLSPKFPMSSSSTLNSHLTPSSSSLRVTSSPRSPKPRAQDALSKSDSLDSANFGSVGTPPVDVSLLLNPQDHSKLKQAWEDMLHRRFLSPGLLSVLPFYLSSVFPDIQTHSTIHIPLPPNSPSAENVAPIPAKNGANGVHLGSKSKLTAEISLSLRSRSSDSTSSPPPYSTSCWAWMHLARTVSIVSGCKEAVWDEYKQLGEFRIIAAAIDPEAPTLREEFEAAWANWKHDMKDRMSLRTKCNECLSWDTPLGCDRPDWKAWRDRVGEHASEWDAGTEKRDLCRSLKGFVAWKPAEIVH